jgi:hypothetical protein
VAEPYPELEQQLRPLADPLPPPRPDDWLGNTTSRARRLPSTWTPAPSARATSCLVGKFNQRRILAHTQDYLSVYSDAPVKEMLCSLSRSFVTC